MNLNALTKRPVILALMIFIGSFIIYSSISSYGSLPAYQWGVLVAITVFSAVIYTLLDSGSIKSGSLALGVVVAAYFIVALGVFHPTMDNIFRSDYWFILALFEKMGGFTLQNIKSLSVFEFMGDLRFQPLAHILMYLRHLLLHDNVFLFHLLNIALHVVTGSLVFLVIRKITRDCAFSFIFGLLFIVLQSQFDTVVWTYHIYIILGAISFLIAALLALNYHETDKRIYLYIATFFSLISILLYEPSILVPAAVFFIVLFRGSKDGGKEGIGRLVFPAALALLAYLIYLGITLYGMTLINQGEKRGLSSLLAWGNLTLAIKGTFINLWESTILKNTGGAARIHIFDIVYIFLPEGFYTAFVNIVKIALSLLLISFFRVSRDKRGMLIVFSLVALSYIFIISLGRVNSNSITYLVSQPRYQYFVNAAVLIISALLISTKYRQKEYKLIIVVLLAAIFFWNSQNVLHANNRVDEEMDFLNAPYYRIDAFLKENPSTKVYVNYAPLNELRFYLGSDIVFDMLFDERVTRFSRNATHIFDGERFRVNEGYGKASPSPYLEDFNLSWAFLKLYKSGVLAHEYTVAGSKDSYPHVSITPDGYVVVRLKDASSGDIDVYRFRQPSTLTSKNFAMMEVIKAGESLCLRVNGLVTHTFPLKYKYEKWDKDGREFLGEYYSGKGGVSYLTMLFMTHDRERLQCL